MKVPCELIVWHILPGIRREFARILVEELNLTQREAAKKLGLTESAVSQYLKLKRGKKTKFNQEIIDEIKKAAREILSSKDDSLVNVKICSICALVRDYGFLCKLHRAGNAKLNDSQVCME